MRGISIAAFATMLLIASSSRASAFDPASADWEGCSELVEIARQELGPSRVLVVDEIDYEKLGPTDGILLIHPMGAYDVDELTAFMKLGGRVAVADDFGDGDRLLARFRIERLPAPNDPLQMLRGNPQLPIAVPASQHPIVTDVKHVALNHAAVLRHAALSPLLSIPRSGGTDGGPDVALAGQVGQGRLVAIGDPSIMINSMLRFGGNRAFARNLVAYLLDGAGEHRRQAHLVIVHDHFREKGSRSTGLSGSFRERIRALGGVIDTVRHEGFGGGAARIVALGAALATAVWVASRAASRTKVPRTRYAADDPSSYALQADQNDPRIRPLVAVPVGRRWWPAKTEASMLGLSALADAVESAVATRVDLAALPRQEALARLGQQAGLGPRDVAQVATLIDRIRAAVAGVATGTSRPTRATSREVSLLAKLLATRAPSDIAP